MNQYLASTEIINWKDDKVSEQACLLASGKNDQLEVAKSCFEFVRDRIRHSWDYQLNPVTCRASDVLEHKTGYCYAKSHLLAALLRANSIPAGLCYQRLTISDDQPPFCLHGLNALYLDGDGWYRVDARGNRSDVDARFCPPYEKLAFPVVTEGEMDLPDIWPEPLAIVQKVLESSQSYLDVANHLPDIAMIK